MKNKILLSVISATLLTITNASAFSLGDAASALSAVNSATQTKQAPSAATQKSSDLTSMLTQQLGVTDKQASGGVGSILSYAKTALPQNKYTQLASAIPNAGSLLSMAPKASGSNNALGALAGSLAGNNSAAGLTALASQFSSLGLNSSMVSQFVPVIMNYLKSSGSGSAASILSSLF